MKASEGTQSAEWLPIARELTYAQKQLIAAGRPGEVAPVVYKRARRRLNLSLLNSAGYAFMALVIQAGTGPLFGSAWVRVSGLVVLASAACLNLVLATHTYRAELAYARHLEELSGEESAT